MVEEFLFQFVLLLIAALSVETIIAFALIIALTVILSK